MPPLAWRRIMFNRKSKQLTKSGLPMVETFRAWSPDSDGDDWRVVVRDADSDVIISCGGLSIEEADIMFEEEVKGIKER